MSVAGTVTCKEKITALFGPGFKFTSPSVHCGVTASRADKDDEEVNNGEDKGRTETQSHDVLPLSLSWRPNGRGK
jgi:hypothetical protein